MDKSNEDKKMQERLELAARLDAELDEYINSLEKKSYTDGWPEDKWQEEMEKHPFFMKKSPEPGDELSPLMEGLQQLKYGVDENTPEGMFHNIYKLLARFVFTKYRYSSLFMQAMYYACLSYKIFSFTQN